MPESSKVPIKNKKTGEVSEGRTAKSAMKPNADKIAPENKSLSTSTEQKFTSSDTTHTRNSITNKHANDTKQQEKKPAQLGAKGQKVEIRNLAEYIDYAYSRKGQRLKLTPSWVKSISKHARLDDASFAELLKKSSEDRLLAVPRQLLLTVHGTEGASQVKLEVRRFVSEIFKRHPIYRHNNLVDVLSNLDDSHRPDEAIKMLAKIDPEVIKTLTGMEKAKPKEVEVFRQNAVYCLTIWIWESRSLPIAKVVRLLLNNYWSVLTPSKSDNIGKLRAITDLKEPESLGVACTVFKAEADEQVLVASKLRHRNTEHESTIVNLNQKISALENEVVQRDLTINQLNEVIEIEKSAHANSRVHLGDDREHLRSGVVRRLKSEASLLKDGLQALRKDPPKVRVMDDHAERVLEGLLDEIKHLEAKE
jgi:hypothetical protein